MLKKRSSTKQLQDNKKVYSAYIMNYRKFLDFVEEARAAREGNRKMKKIGEQEARSPPREVYCDYLADPSGLLLVLKFDTNQKSKKLGEYLTEYGIQLVEDVKCSLKEKALESYWKHNNETHYQRSKMKMEEEEVEVEERTVVVEEKEEEEDHKGQIAEGGYSVDTESKNPLTVYDQMTQELVSILATMNSNKVQSIPTGNLLRDALGIVKSLWIKRMNDHGCNLQCSVKQVGYSVDIILLCYSIYWRELYEAQANIQKAKYGREVIN